MKISKVRHTRTAVGKSDNEVAGFLYEDPTKTGKQDIDERLENLGKSAKFLYNVFSPVKAGTGSSAPKKEKYGNDTAGYEAAMENYRVKHANHERRKKLERIVSGRGGVNSVLKGILISNGKAADPRGVFKKISEERYSLDRQTIDELIALSLRKSLRDYSEGVKSMLNNLGKKEAAISGREHEAIIGFIKGFAEDYNRTERNAGFIKKSIEHMNVTVQSSGSGFSAPVPSQTGKKTSHKTNEKNAMNAFLNGYAVLDAKVREDMLRRVRRIVDLYFAAPAGYTKDMPASLPDAVSVDEFSLWDRHEQGKQTPGYFVNVPKELISDKRIDDIKKKKLAESLKCEIRNRNISCYRFAVKVTEEDRSGIFFNDRNTSIMWIHHIENAVERILGNRLTETCEIKLKMSYLKEKVWKDIINYLSIKYIATGKAVFNFGMQDLYGKGDISTLGKAEKAIENGMTSFDLEMIKARENLQREVAVAVMFAVNNYARAAFDTEKDSDILTLNRDRFSENMKYGSDDELRAVLQFFGGKSEWNGKMFTDAYGTGDECTAGLLWDLKECIYSLRNRSFHFATAVTGEGEWNSSLISSMFEKETVRCIQLEKDKMYSNNIPMFYPEGKIRNLLDFLYSKEAPRASQVPAFNRVVVRKNLVKFINQSIGMPMPSFTDSETGDKWLSAFYYVLKEIYYNGFLQSENAKNDFDRAANLLETENGDIKKARAVNDFKKRIDNLKDRSLPEICQQIMTEYNYQNNQKKVRTGRESVFDKERFKHYPLLLGKCIATAFAGYIKGEACLKFLQSPEIREMPLKEDFLPGWTTRRYEKLVKSVREKKLLQSWYITGRFLNGRMLNQLAGSLRSYIEFVGSIKRRAEETQNSLFVNEDMNVKEMTEAVKVIETCILLSSFGSVRFEDYFKDTGEYVGYLKRYVSAKDLTEGEIYMNNGGVPIMNRNVLQAKLYAPDSVLTSCVEKVSENDIKEYLNLSKNISNIRVKMQCDSEDEQNKLLRYQKLKNRVELRTLADYGELVSELLGQLVNWSFMRERDLMYFQLGFHYQCLMNKSIKPGGYENINDWNGRNIKNAILYQIAAMYIYGLDVYVQDEYDSGKKNDDMTSAKIGQFCRYSKNITDDGTLLYNAGIELFEVEREHDVIIDIRNYINHFRYYNTGTENNRMSLLSLYSEVFDRYFIYDMKYRKSVIDILGNVLARHQVIADYSLGTGIKKVDRKQATKNRANIDISKLEAEKFTYCIGKEEEKKKLKTSAKDKDYLNTVLRILYYPGEPSNAYIADSSGRMETEENEKRAEKSIGQGNKQAYAGKKKKDDRSEGMSLGDTAACSDSLGALIRKLNL